MSAWQPRQQPEASTLRKLWNLARRFDMASPNESSRPGFGDQGAARDESTGELRRGDSAVTTTLNGKIIAEVRSWINGSRLAYWCDLCLTWHSHAFESAE